MPRVQVAEGVPFVAIAEVTAALAAVPHLGLLHADPPILGYPAPQLPPLSGSASSQRSTVSSAATTRPTSVARSAGSSQSQSRAAFRLRVPSSKGAPASLATAASPRPCWRAITP